jgi:MFS family permease
MPQRARTSGLKHASVRLGVIVLVGLAAGSAYLTRHCIAVANTTIQQELQLPPERMGLVLGAFSAGYFLFQIPGGWLGNRIGSRAAFSLISTLWSLLTLWTASAGSFVSLLLSRAFFGAAQAGLVPISAQVINDWFTVRRRGICSSVVGASMSAGGVLTMWLTAELMTEYHWRSVFRLYALVGIAWGIVFYLYFRTLPREHPWLNDRAPERPAGETEDVPAETDGAASPALAPAAIVAHIIFSRTIWGINAQSFFRAFGYGLLVTWFPAFLEYRFGITPVEAGKLTTYPLIGIVVGTLFGGLVVDLSLHVTGSRWISRSGTSFVALAASGGLIYAAAAMETPARLVILMTAASLCSGLGNPPAWAATMDVAGRHTAVIMGAMNMAGTLGGFMSPLVVGYMIADIKAAGGDWNAVIHLVAVIYCLGALCWLAVNPNDPPPGEVAPERRRNK